MAYDTLTNGPIVFTMFLTITSKLPNLRIRLSIADQFRDSVMPSINQIRQNTFENMGTSNTVFKTMFATPSTSPPTHTHSFPAGSFCLFPSCSSLSLPPSLCLSHLLTFCLSPFLPSSVLHYPFSSLSLSPSPFFLIALIFFSSYFFFPLSSFSHTLIPLLPFLPPPLSFSFPSSSSSPPPFFFL